jgi:hypothetical protein
MGDLGRTLLVVGGVMFVVGLLLTFGARIPGLGRLPGDILSLLLTAILAFFRR